MPSVYTEKARAIDILEVFLSRERCPGCNKPLIEGFDRRYVNLTKNHINFNRTDNQNQNFNIFHRGCHTSYHKQLRKRMNIISEAINSLFQRVENNIEMPKMQ